jgi:hypothetical protein
MTEAAGDTQPTNPFPTVRPDWLARRVEPIIDPDYPIVDPHHHLFDSPMWRYRFDDFLEDLNTGHNVIATVFAECGAMYKAFGPEARRPIGETEFVTGVAAMSDSGRYGPTQICAGIVGHADLTLSVASPTCWKRISSPPAAAFGAFGIFRSTIPVPQFAARHTYRLRGCSDKRVSAKALLVWRRSVCHLMRGSTTPSFQN